MKKFAIILLMFVYGTTTIGATVHIHYCMDKFVSWDLNHSENEKCGKCGMKEDTTKKGCCKDEQKELKINNDQQKSTTASFIELVYSSTILQPIFSHDFKINNFEKSTALYFHPPPPFTIQKLIILYCTYLI